MIPPRLARDMLRVVTSLGAWSLLPCLVGAQTTTLLQKGARVRILTPAAEGRPETRITGRLLRLEDDTVTINASAGLAAPQILSYGLDHGRRLEWLASSHGHGGRGALLGALFGALGGGLLGAATYKPCSGFCPVDSQGMNAVGGAFVGAVGGALVGLILGSSSRTDSWVPLETTGLRISVAPATRRRTTARAFAPA